MCYLNFPYIPNISHLYRYVVIGYIELSLEYGIIIKKKRRSF